MPRLESCRFLYPGHNQCLSICQIDIHALSDGRIAVICSELEDNPGSCVTACAADLAGLVCRDRNIDPAKLVWIEHNPERGQGDNRIPETWELVTFSTDLDSSGQIRYSDPAWRLMGLPDWSELGLPHPLAT